MFRKLLVVALIINPLAALADTVTMQVTGMTCSACASKIEARMRQYDAVENVAINVEKGEVVVTTRETAPLPDSALKRMVTEAGYKVESIRR